MLRASFPRAQKRDLSGFLVAHPVPLPGSETPGRTGQPGHSGFSSAAARIQHGEGFRTTMISRLVTGLRYPLSTLHERRCRRPCKTRLGLASSAFAGRASNPLGHDERFQITLSSTCPDASWSHGRRKFFELAKSGEAPIARDAVRRIDMMFVSERPPNGKTPG